MGTMVSQINSSLLFAPLFIQTHIKENVKAALGVPWQRPVAFMGSRATSYIILWVIRSGAPIQCEAVVLPAWGPRSPLFGWDDHKIVSSQQWDFLCWWDVIFTLSRAPESAILVIRTSWDAHYFLYVHLSLILPNKFLSSEFCSQTVRPRAPFQFEYGIFMYGFPF